MTLCNSKQQIVAIWPYGKSKPPLGKFPNKFPCFVEFSSCDCGINGYGYSLEVVFPPKGVDLESFQKGLVAKREVKGVF